MLKVLIVDDEPLAHAVLLHHCGQHADLQVISQCYSVADALQTLGDEQVDLILLDIRMPLFSGLDFLRGVRDPPTIVLVTAYEEFALEAFELDVTDYLLKPVSPERFAASMDKVRRRHANRHGVEEAKENPLTDIVLKVDRVLRRFMLAEVDCFEAYGNYVKVWQGKDVCLATCTLKALLEQLPRQQFLQVHKSYLVNCARVLERGVAHVRLRNGITVQIGKTFREEVKVLLPARKW